MLGKESLVDECLDLLFVEALLLWHLLDEVHVIEDDLLHCQSQNLLLIKLGLHANVLGAELVDVRLILAYNLSQKRRLNSLLNVLIITALAKFLLDLDEDILSEVVFVLLQVDILFPLRCN